MTIESARPTLNPALRDFWLAKARNRVLIGGRASSKSWDAEGFATFLADNYKLRVLCVRQLQNRIEESVYALLKIQIDRFGLGERFRILDNKILNSGTGSEFMFYGLWRHIAEIKSLESVDILWIEEGHSLTEEQWKILEPTIRKEGSQVWIVFNPFLATDFAYQRFVVNPPPETIVRLINYDENPFLSSTMIKIIEAAKAESEANGDDEFAHIYLGQPRDDDDNVIIKRSWILAAVDAHKALNVTPSGTKRIGFDVADSGNDKCATVFAHGCVVSWADMWKAGEDELLKSCTRVYHAARDRSASVTYDSIGVGAGCGAKFGELNASLKDANRVIYAKFNAGGAVWRPEAVYSQQIKNKDMFSNIKAQAWWLLADRFRNTYNAIRNGQQFKDDELISLSSEMPHLELLITELSTPKRDYDQNGRVKVESKKDLAKREIASPNVADAIVMAFAPAAAPIRINDDLLRTA
jgi:phage terminase large subunit